MANVISFFNQAGGTGKTTLAMNLGYSLTQQGHRVLLVDMDPQSSLTVFMGLQPHELEGTVAQSILEREPLRILSEIHQMDLVPSNLTLSAADVRLATAIAKENRLKKALSPVVRSYDFVLIDCPPTLGVLSIISLVASTHILIPMQTQYKSFVGLDLLLGTINELQQEGVAPDLKIAGVIPNLHDRTAQSKEILEAVTEQFSGIAPVFPAISRAVAFADASMQHLPLGVYDPKHPAVAILTAISQSLESL
ncbi:MAG: ParA family protein [Oscillatoriophycideae cyanobacterium NC_groundwater_1537_Pr4_S-0.65um_50_18]|nr:ParA family protein [Oscillatoriophycideae cyanobacterium NC_groundwater_1537_Pr4_S-0.65um_50_18]